MAYIYESTPLGPPTLTRVNHFGVYFSEYMVYILVYISSLNMVFTKNFFDVTFLEYVCSLDLP